MIKFGLTADNCCQPMPHFSSVPGRKFSITMSASATSLRTISWPSSDLRSSVTDFLLRLWEYHHNEVPSCSLRHLRKGSPVPGGSILMTSAPNWASSALAYGPAINEPSSSTLTPESAISAADVLSCIVSPLFISTYDRLNQPARKAGKAAGWFPSLPRGAERSSHATEGARECKNPRRAQAPGDSCLTRVDGAACLEPVGPGRPGLRLDYACGHEPAHHRPRHVAADGTTFCDFDRIAFVVLIGFIMRLVTIGADDDLAVDRMLDTTFDADDDRLVHLVADNFADQRTLALGCL